MGLAQFNVLSLFDGMSCGQIALNRAGTHYDNYYASEIDKYAIKVTQANYPNTIQLGNITKIQGSDLPKIDLLIGGSPCQGFSFAGKQLNFDDPRSALFFEYVRLLKETQPTYFLLENVRMKKESQDVISAALGVEPIMIDSALVSAQSRKRLYWTNIPNVTQPDDKGILLQDILENGTALRNKSYCVRSSQETKISNSVIQRYFDRRIGNIVDMVNSYRLLTLVECERLQTVSDGYTAHVSDSQRYKMLGNGWTVDVIAHILKNINHADNHN
jgi:site-specific DNA-cytosine methylase